jgi:FkbM family methyltransferase
MLKALAKHLLHGAGFSVSRLPTRHQWHLDAFSDQAGLLRDRAVRTVIDAGADIGTMTRRYRDMFPNARIYCFEPFEPSWQKLSANFRDDRNVEPLRLGLAEVCGRRRFSVNRDSRTNSLLPVSPRHGDIISGGVMDTVSVGEVEVITLDAFCVARGIDRVDVLKLDVQGAEVLALKGAADLLRAKRVDLVYTEVVFAPMYEGQGSFCELNCLLQEMGYVLYGLYDLKYPSHAADDGGNLAWADAIFLPGRS